ncbi:MAG: hypothetical protein OQK73_00945 [Gammaproteobacteria bacterium]|nr:hypothetical protein [Gammaproteobacteria bacterium]
MKNESPWLEKLPDWVRWIAQDEDGTWWGYSVEPLQQHCGWYENEVGRHLKLGINTPNPDWKDSLQKI